MSRLQRYTTILLSIIVSVASHAEATTQQLIERAAIKEGPTATRDHPNWRATQRILLRDVGLDAAGSIAALENVEVISVSSLSEAMRHAESVDAIIGYCNADLIAAAERLVWVQIYSAGAERCVTVPEIANGDVLLTNMQKMSSPVIAEHAIAMMFALSRNLPQFTRNMDDGHWDRSAEQTAGMRPIAGKTLLVAGLGGIGTEVARLGSQLGMQVVGTRNSSRSGPDFVSYVGLSHELNELAENADVVVNALPYTEQTADTFDTEFFATLKQDAIFVNVGRGKTVDTDALLAALRSGRLGGAGLDVTDPEPLPDDHPLWQQRNVVITPHVAGSGGERERHMTLLIENLRRYSAGERLLNVVDPQKGY